MASLGSSFDATGVDTTQRDYTPLPDGDYKLEVEASDVAATKKGDGTILKLTYRVIEPEEFADRKIFANINISNPNPTAQETGQRELASLCRAVELPKIDDSEELHFRSFMAKVGLDKARKDPDGNDYPRRNKIKRFYFPDEGVPEAKAAPAAQQQSAAPAASAPAAAPAKARPWGKK